jgi:cardiolipin synthase A/B
MIIELVRWGVTALILVAAVIGFLFVTRGTVMRRVRGVGADGEPVAPSEPEFPLTVAMVTACSLIPGNHVEIALNGDGTFDCLWTDLESAKQAITLQMYYMGPGRTADRLAKILTERARAGVPVLFLYDAFGASDLPRSYWAALRAAGVKAVAFRSLRLRNLWVVQNRAHIRGIVIDARIGWTGGFGIDDKWLGNGRIKGQWRDTNVRFEGPAVRQLQAAFVAAWTEATGALVSGRVVAQERDAGVHAAALLATEPTLGSTAAERFLAMSIAGARRSLYVTNAYFTPDGSFTKLVADAARRGVDIRLLVGGANTDVDITRLAARHRYDALLSAGVRVYEYAASTLHAKTFVVDGCWSSIGTMNFDNRSLALNDESTLMVLDAEFGQRMNEIFMEDLRCALEIDLITFRRRSRLVRIAEWAANLVAPLL